MTGDGFEMLMLLLDPDPDSAAVKFQQVRRRIISYLSRRGCRIAEDLVDEAVKRVSAKLSAGVEIGNIDHYWYGVARNVLREYWSAQGKEHIQSIADLTPSEEPFVDPAAAEREDEAIQIEELKNECMRRCLKSLPNDERTLIIEYCKKGDREQLALSLGLTLKNLRVRVHRLRERLNGCLKNCIEKESALHRF